MSSSDKEEKKSLEVRLSAIENKLKELIVSTGMPVMTKASDEDRQSFLKVLRAAMDDDPAWGINECQKCIVTCRVCDICVVTCRQCDRCIVTCRVCDICVVTCRQCDRCIQECIGPCIQECGPCGPGECLACARSGPISKRSRQFESLGY